jgi:hypothetical protein
MLLLKYERPVHILQSNKIQNYAKPQDIIYIYNSSIREFTYDEIGTHSLEHPASSVKR